MPQSNHGRWGRPNPRRNGASPLPHPWHTEGCPSQPNEWRGQPAALPTAARTKAAILWPPPRVALAPSSARGQAASKAATPRATEAAASSGNEAAAGTNHPAGPWGRAGTPHSIRDAGAVCPAKGGLPWPPTCVRRCDDILQARANRPRASTVAPNGALRRAVQRQARKGTSPRCRAGRLAASDQPSLGAPSGLLASSSPLRSSVIASIV